MKNSSIRSRRLSAVSARLIEDHERIRMLLRQLQGSIGEICRRYSPDDLQSTRETLQVLHRFLEMHVSYEEKIIFPALGKHYPNQAQEAEHEEIRLKQAAIESGIFNYSFPEDCTNRLYDEYRRLIAQFQDHMDKEESTVLPLLETLSSAEKDRITEQIDLLRAQAGF